MLKAKKIISDSEFTRKKVTEHFLVKKEKLIVICPGVGFRDGEKGGELGRYGLKTKMYLLNNGGMDERKNIERLLRAFLTVVKGEKDVKLKLVITGGGILRKTLEELVDNLGLGGRVIFTGWVKESEIAALVRNAKAVIYPSLDEGFGLPVLEAIAEGVPVVTSDIPVLREVGGKWPIYIDPKTERSLFVGIKKVLNLKKVNGRKVFESKRWASGFSWEKTIRKIKEVYSETLED